MKIYIPQQVPIRALAEALGKKPFRVLADVMEFKQICPTINDSVGFETASKVAQKYGFAAIKHDGPTCLTEQGDGDSVSSRRPVPSCAAQGEPPERPFWLGHFEEAYARTRIQLAHGCPGCFYVFGNGCYITAVHAQTGLPIRLAGDVVGHEAMESVGGSNKGTHDHIQQHGLPWNSRLDSIQILSDMKGYFDANINRAIDLASGASFTNGVATLKVRQESRSVQRSRPCLEIELQSESLFQAPQGLEEAIEEAMVAYRAGRRELALPKEKPQVLRPGAFTVRVRFCAQAHNITCVDGPENSQIAVFRFSNFDADAYRPMKGERFEALDLQSGDWLRGGLSYRPRLSETKGEIVSDIFFQCSICGEFLAFPPELSNQLQPCPACKGMIEVPSCSSRPG